MLIFHAQIPELHPRKSPAFGLGLLRRPGDTFFKDSNFNNYNNHNQHLVIFPPELPLKFSVFPQIFHNFPQAPTVRRRKTFSGTSAALASAASATPTESGSDADDDDGSGFSMFMPCLCHDYWSIWMRMRIVMMMMMMMTTGPITNSTHPINSSPSHMGVLHTASPWSEPERYWRCKDGANHAVISTAMGYVHDIWRII